VPGDQERGGSEACYCGEPVKHVWDTCVTEGRGTLNASGGALFRGKSCGNIFSIVAAISPTARGAKASTAWALVVWHDPNGERRSNVRHVDEHARLSLRAAEQECKNPLSDFLKKIVESVRMERLFLGRLEAGWAATMTTSGRVASRRNVTRGMVVVSLSFLLFFRGLPGADRPAPGDFQLFRNSRFDWRINRLSQAAHASWTSARTKAERS
jgi:hypothetical protein